jgi:hypothetical protein
MSSTYGGIDNFPALVTLIGDTDVPNAGNFNPAPEGLADRTVWLKNRVGSARIASATLGAYDVAVDDTGSTVAVSFTDVTITPANSFPITTVGAGLAAVNDILDIQVNGTMALPPAGSAGIVRGALFLTVKIGAGAWARVPAAMAQLNLNEAASGIVAGWAPFTIRARYVVTSTSATQFGLCGIIQAAATAVQLIGSYSMLITQTRVNP